MPFAKINQNNLSFLAPKPLKPDCPLFVFLPGMDGTGQLLHTQTDKLERFFDIRCLTIPTDDLNSWDVLSKQVLDLIIAEVQTRPQNTVYLCGESFGGCLALKVALIWPQLFKKIILVNPASAFHRRPWLSWGTEFVSWMPDLVYRSSALGLLPMLAALSRIAPSDRRALLNAMRTVPPKTAAWRISMVKDFVLEELNLQKLTQPVLLIASGSDRLLPSVEEAEYLFKRLPNPRMIVLPESGHACLLEKDVLLYEILKAEKFLEAQEYHDCSGAITRF
jgi:pimeloyl-ACP methyl ester carboxylesterase